MSPRPADVSPTDSSFWRRHRRRIAAALLLALAVLVSLLSAWRDRQPTHQGRLLMDWAADLGSTNATRSAAAREAVLALGPEAVPALVRNAQRADPLLMRPMIGLARWLPAGMGRALWVWMRPADNARIRSQALSALTVLGPVAAPAAPALGRITRRAPSQDQVTDWMMTVAVLGALGPAAVEPLIEALRSAPAHLRPHPLLALAKIGPPAARAMPGAMAVWAADPTAEWSALAPFLGAVGPDATMQQWLAHLDSPDATQRGRLADVLSRTAQRSGPWLEALIAAWPDQPPRGRVELLGVLARLHPPRPAVARLMLRALADPENAIRLEATAWLRERLSPEALDHLLRSEPAEIQARAREFLGGS